MTAAPDLASLLTDLPEPPCPEGCTRKAVVILVDSPPAQAPDIVAVVPALRMILTGLGVDVDSQVNYLIHPHGAGATEGWQDGTHL